MWFITLSSLAKHFLQKTGLPGNGRNGTKQVSPQLPQTASNTFLSSKLGLPVRKAGLPCHAKALAEVWSKLFLSALSGFSFFSTSKQALQKTALLPFGRKGSWHSLPHLLQVALCIIVGPPPSRPPNPLLPPPKLRPPESLFPNSLGPLSAPDLLPL